jgi:hypothetical protein
MSYFFYSFKLSNKFIGKHEKLRAAFSAFVVVAIIEQSCLNIVYVSNHSTQNQILPAFIKIRESNENFKGLVQICDNLLSQISLSI